MKSLFALLLLLTAALPLRAQWRIAEREGLASPEGLVFERVEVANADRQAELHVVTFSPKTNSLAVMDNPQGAYDTGTAAVKRGALAAVNGGYFQPDHTPLGLVVRKGVEIHPLEHARLLSGLVAVTSREIALHRVSEYKPSASVREALQAGPFLVDGGKTVPGLEATRSARRTVVFSTTDGRFGLLIAQTVTLADLAAILTQPGVAPSGKITRALNLDGGTSTALWVRGDPPFYAREWKPVRTYLAIVPH
jgi:uncharacterized protein YigE (DUF2233 family)